MNTLH